MSEEVIRIVHADTCPVSRDDFVPWIPEYHSGPRPADYPTCNCDFGKRLKAHFDPEDGQ